jgi:hypothetical protein
MKAICFISLCFLFGFHSSKAEAVKSFPSCKSCEAKAKPIRQTTSFKKKTNLQKVTVESNNQANKIKKP